MKKIALLVCIFMFFSMAVYAAPEIDCKSALLMEQTTGKILFEHNPHEKLPPASVTKIMTMLLTMEAIDAGNMSLSDNVTSSERAKSMGGSTIFLDTGEVMSVDDIMKGIAVASGNDACVAIAEHIAGSESDFVALMNNRARELGMNDTNFVNCNGLDADGHLTSAHDIAIMSRELLKHEGIFKYTTIWTDTLRGGAFNLANTNKLIRFYSGANGLKTGSTSQAGFCLSGTAKRDNLQLIAVVMGGKTSAIRFSSAKAMLDYGFANYAIVKPSEDAQISGSVRVRNGVSDVAEPEISSNFSTLVEKNKKNDIISDVQLADELDAPIKKGDKLGSVIFRLGNDVIGECDLVAKNEVKRKSFGLIYLETLQHWLR